MHKFAQARAELAKAVAAVRRAEFGNAEASKPLQATAARVGRLFDEEADQLKESLLIWRKFDRSLVVTLPALMGSVWIELESGPNSASSLLESEAKDHEALLEWQGAAEATRLTGIRVKDFGRAEDLKVEKEQQAREKELLDALTNRKSVRTRTHRKLAALSAWGAGRSGPSTQDIVSAWQKWAQRSVDEKSMRRGGGGLLDLLRCFAAREDDHGAYERLDA